MKRKKNKPAQQTLDLENLSITRATINLMMTPQFRESVKTADISLTFPTSIEWNQQIAYGTQTLQCIASKGLTIELTTLSIVIDWNTTESEYLIELVRYIKDDCDFN